MYNKINMLHIYLQDVKRKTSLEKLKNHIFGLRYFEGF